MRAIKTTATCILALGLLAGSAIGVTAYVGEGEYDGLVFYATLQDDGDSLWGYITPEPPPVPETVPER